MKKKCSRCGYDRCSRALHMHHLITPKKRRSRKFIILCANCHAEIHSELSKNGTKNIDIRVPHWLKKKRKHGSARRIFTCSMCKKTKKVYYSKVIIDDKEFCVPCANEYRFDRDMKASDDFLNSFLK